MAPDPRGDEERVAAWIAAALEQLEAGREVDLDELCADAPEHIPDVAAALGLRHELASLRRAHDDDAAGDDGRLLAGRYRLRAPIGSGAAGTVYVATDERLQRDVAVKLLHRGLFGGGGESEARFHREAVVLAAHEHEHIVRIYDQGRTDDGTSYLVTELLRGRSLQQVLDAAQRAMPDGPSLAAFGELSWLRELLPDAKLETTWLRQTVTWIAQLGEGLCAAHASHVCHRDVKPSNAHVRDDGQAVLLDFGIATTLGDAAITRTHSVLGTPSYMAPEQAAGRSDPRPALDIYGLTATLYHLLTLRPPHEGDLQQVLVALREDDPLPAARFCKGLPRDLQAMLDRGLERDPRRRYPTMRALVDDLRAFLEHAPVTARPLSPWTRSWRRVVRRPARALAVSATAAAIVFGAIALPAWTALQADAAEKDRAQRLARLPADLCIEGWPDMRPLVPLDEQRAVLDELDGLLELDGEDLGIRLLRAASRLDFGHVDGAREDLRAIAAQADTAYVRELAERYANASRGGGGDRGVVDLTGMPEPQTTTEHFLAGFHALRARDSERAKQLLTEAVDYLPARDLRLLAILDARPNDPELAIREASTLEGIYGHQTARTQHALAVAHLQLHRYRKAMPFCERSLAIRPERHGPLTNLAYAHQQLGELAQAEHFYRRAVERRPWLPNSLTGLSQTLRDQGRFDEARDVAMQIGDDGWRHYVLGNLEVHRALQCQRQRDRDGQRDASLAAFAHFERSAQDVDSDNPKKASVKYGMRVAEHLADNRLAAALTPLLVQMRSDPRNARKIANLSSLLGAELTPTSQTALRLWLLSLAIELAPDEPDYRRMWTELTAPHRKR